MNVPGVGENIYNTIRKHILDGIYATGERLNVDELSRTLDTSKTPIREALGRLESEKLVVFKPRIGWSVNLLNVETFTDFIEFQCALRFFISDNLSPYIDNLDFDFLNSVNEKLRNLLESRDYLQIVRQNDLFHMTILSVHPNKTILRRLDELDALIRLQRVRFFEHEKNLFPAIASNSFEQHQLILEKLKTRDSCAISCVSREHFASILKAYKQITLNGSTFAAQNE